MARTGDRDNRAIAWYAHKLLKPPHGVKTTARRCERALSYWRELDVERHSHDLFLDRMWQLRPNVSAHDAACVALTEALSTVLVTGDRRLQRVPGLAIRIELA